MMSQICNGGEIMNLNALKGKIKEREETQKTVANAIGISMNSLSRKLAGKREFKLSEAIKLAEFLELDDPCSIFFD